MASRIYEPNPKHKRGTCGEGPPRWFPSRDSLCPDSLTTATAQALLDESVEGVDPSHPNGRARYSLHEGELYKAYSTETRRVGDEDVEVWHGYLVRRALVPRQVPARVLREFQRRGRLSNAEYRKLLGNAR